jgi:acyl-CoA thioester hydrolase
VGEPTQGTSSTTSVDVVVKSTDLGSDRHVRGEVYFTYFEQSRLEHLRRLAIVPVFPPPPDAQHYFAIAETSARYREPAHFGDTLTVHTTTEHVGNRSFTLSFEITNGSGRVVAEGRSVQVWLGADGRPEAIPGAPRARLVASIPARMP